jgi:hypothetical protein
VKDDIEQMFNKDLPFSNLKVNGVLGGAEAAAVGAQLLLEGLQVNWFNEDAVATLDASAIEPYVANILFVFAMEAHEYALKEEEYAFLTTSTTTTRTATYTTTTTLATAEPQASGAVQFVEGDVMTVVSALDQLKQVYDAKAEALQEEGTTVDNALEALSDDRDTKANTYEAMKLELDACDKAGEDKLNTVSYPDSCADEKKGYDEAANDFLAFVEGKGGQGTYANQVSTLFGQKGRSLDKLAQLQADYKDDLMDIIK